MEKKLNRWIALLGETKQSIIEALHYNGLIIDDLESVIEDIQETVDIIKMLKSST